MEHHVGYGKNQRGASFTMSVVVITDMVYVFFLNIQNELSISPCIIVSVSNQNTFQNSIIILQIAVQYICN